MNNEKIRPLPQGITGFDALNEGVPVKRFTAACHAAARQVSGRVHQVRAAHEQPSSNFHEATLSLRDESKLIRVLCNAHHAILAFASPSAHEGDLQFRFVDCPELARALSSEFGILSTQEASTDVSPDAIAQLGKAEMNQMRYWNPQRIGDVIFNHWD